MLKSRGFSLIELLVTLAIAGILLAMAVPAFSAWLVNTRIRNVATTFHAGLQQARAEAISRNAQVRFQPVTNMSGSCAISANGTAWVVNMVSAGDNVGGKCDSAIDNSGTTTAPFIIAKSGIENTGAVVVTASSTDVRFNALGKLTPIPAAGLTYDFSATSNGGCAANGGELTCLRVLVSTSGQIRMCNPRFPAGDPQAC